MSAPTILTLDALGDAPVGGKAEGLAKLVRLGLRVPRAFVIVGATPGNLPADLEARYQELGGAAVAVRSSALGEDSAGASFAGQYETILDVTGIDALRTAVDTCLASLQNERAAAYRQQGAHGDTDVAMSVVVQSMVPAASAGVLFTADPVTGRRDRIVIDAVEGLGEALVSGCASPDHYVLDRTGPTREAQLEGATPILGDAVRRNLVASALAAEAAEGCPLDLEWAVDADGDIHWLQARPITHLPPDPNELDTPITDPTQVFTRCNVGEMFPGACTPLSYSFTARSIDVGMQMMHVQVGIQDAVVPDMRFLIIMNSGHLFLNLSTMSETATHALGSSADQMALSVCGRPVTEFTISGGDPPPRLRRIANGIRYIRYLLSQPAARRDMKNLVAELHFPEAETALAAWQEIDRRFPRIYDAMHHHLISSAGSGVLTPTLLGVVAGGTEASEADHATVAALLAGADDVESADIIAGAERIQERVAAHPDGEASFTRAEPDAALEWIRSAAAGAAREEFERYLHDHGHRAIKELELRQPEWREDPLPVIRSLQVSLRQRDSVDAMPRRAESAGAKPGRGVALLARMARQAVRSREETKSGLVAVTTRFKEAYRHLARLMVAEGLLPDADALFFLTHDELGRLARGSDTGLVAAALARREAFDVQETYEFPDVFQGEPTRVDLDLAATDSAGVVRGSPVSRGRVTGVARIVRTIDEASALQRGEILIAPITDVGWTPYFSLIAGLVTDIGSAVSHGAVVAREYGLPAVVNTRIATRVFRTGDRIVLDGESGIVRLADDDGQSASSTRVEQSRLALGPLL